MPAEQQSIEDAVVSKSATIIELWKSAAPKLAAVGGGKNPFDKFDKFDDWDDFDKITFMQYDDDGNLTGVEVGGH